MSGLSLEKAKLYLLAFDMFFSGELTLRRFSHLTDQARFLISDGDGILQDIAGELSSLLEDTVDDPALLSELNSKAGQHGKHRYISLEQAYPQIQMLYARLLDFLAAAEA